MPPTKSSPTPSERQVGNIAGNSKLKEDEDKPCCTASAMSKNIKSPRICVEKIRVRQAVRYRT